MHKTIYIQARGVERKIMNQHIIADKFRCLKYNKAKFR